VPAIVIARSLYNGGPLREGNRTWEADRFSGCLPKAKRLIPSDHERVSPNESESVSASLHKMSAAILPDWVKPATCGEEMSVCIRKALRGEREERARTDVQRNLGDPLRQGILAEGYAGINNRFICLMWESERPIVVRKQGNACGAKGPCLGHVE